MAVTVKAGSVTLYQNGVVVVDSKPVGTYPMFGQTYTYIGKSCIMIPLSAGHRRFPHLQRGAFRVGDLCAGKHGKQPRPEVRQRPLLRRRGAGGRLLHGTVDLHKSQRSGWRLLGFCEAERSILVKCGTQRGALRDALQRRRGINRINVRVTDSSGATDDATLYITVNNVNQPPLGPLRPLPLRR